MRFPLVCPRLKRQVSGSAAAVLNTQQCDVLLAFDITSFSAHLATKTEEVDFVLNSGNFHKKYLFYDMMQQFAISDVPMQKNFPVVMNILLSLSIWLSRYVHLCRVSSYRTAQKYRIIGHFFPKYRTNIGHFFPKYRTK